MPPVPASGMTLKRITREIADLRKEDTGGISLTPSSESMFNWTAVLPGPEGSLYEGGEFHLAITLPSDYPFSAPHVKFITRIYHMNIATPGGSICIDILKSSWSAALSLYKVILSISSLLTDPNPSDPLVPQIAEQYRRNRHQHDETARAWTREYAKPKQKRLSSPDINPGPGPSHQRTRSRPNPPPMATGGANPSEPIDLSHSSPPRVPAALPTSASNPIEVGSSPEPEDPRAGHRAAAAAAARKRRREEEGGEEGGRAGGSRRRRGPTGGGGSGADVIVID